MKRALALFLIGACLAATPTHIDDAALRAALQPRYDALKVAMAARDAAAVGALLAPNFASVDLSGTSETADQMLQELAAIPKDPKRTSVTTLVSITQAGSIATVQQQYDMKTVKHRADQSPFNVELITLSTDTWTNATGTWLMQRTQTKSLDYYIDGRLATHQDAIAPQ